MHHLNVPRFRWLAALAFMALLAVAIAPSMPSGSAEPPALRTAGTIEIAGSPDGIEPFMLYEAFPNLRFERPVWIGQPPDGTDYLWVAEQGGLIKVFKNERSVSKATVALDLRKKVARGHREEGLQCVAFHPDFKKNKTIYVTYSADSPRRLVLSRFETSGSRRRVRANTERELLRQRQPYGNHNGGCIAFGPDGKLYLSLGDGGSRGDPQGHAQNLDTWLGTILRLDVSDKTKVSAPDDNPFVGVQHTEPEIWAYGLQNPRRFSFDRLTGDLWVGDVGNVKFQEINLIEKGGNYGWNLLEGTETFKAGKALVDLREPLAVLGPDESQRITGGVVYRGRKLPGLIGAYVYGDAVAGSVWALRSDGKNVTENLLLGRGQGVSSFGEDRNGEIYLTTYAGKVLTLRPWSGHKPKGSFPRRLSDTGLFTDMTAMTPHPSLIEYSLNMPLWSDGAHKQRFVMLPGMEKIKVDKRGNFDFPVGTIFVKTFYLGEKERGPLPGSRLETRLFLRQQRGWVGYTYVWDDEQRDAHLLDKRLEQPREDLKDDEGNPVNWTFPSRADCMACHTEVAGRVLGFRLEQINRVHDYGGTKLNQLDVFNKLGMFEGKVTPKMKAWPDWEDPKANERVAVRAWLDSNCAMCHQPNGPGNALIDLRFETPIEETNMIDRRPGQWDLDIYKARLLVPGNHKRSLLHARMKLTSNPLGMPPIAYNVMDKKAMERIARWIDSLKPSK